MSTGEIQSLLIDRDGLARETDRRDFAQSSRSTLPAI